MCARALAWVCLFYSALTFRVHPRREQERDGLHEVHQRQYRVLSSSVPPFLAADDITAGWQISWYRCKAMHSLQNPDCNRAGQPLVSLTKQPELSVRPASGQSDTGISVNFGETASITLNTESISSAPCALEMDDYTPDLTENAKYFSDYAHMSLQMTMLEDSLRTGAYMDAIKANKQAFEGKVVLDVGAGTCVLAMFAAQAGAKRVYAVEASAMAERGKRIVEANGFADKVHVIRGTIETINLPEKVDIIVSEWMGCFLLFESMLDSVLVARDRWLKDDGVLFPSHASLFVAPISGCELLQTQDYCFDGEKEQWAHFASTMQGRYRINVDCVEKVFEQERHEYLLQAGADVKLVADNLHAEGEPILHIDLKEVQAHSLKFPNKPYNCTWRITRPGAIQGFCGYFEVYFKGSKELPLVHEKKLTTAPPKNSSDVQHTHWQQQVFGFYPPLHFAKGDMVDCLIRIGRQKINPRKLVLDTEFIHWNGEMKRPPVKETYYMN